MAMVVEDLKAVASEMEQASAAVAAGFAAAAATVAETTEAATEAPEAATQEEATAEEAPPPTAWDRLPAADREGMLLATEARTLGSQGGKHGNDVGAVLVVPAGRDCHILPAMSSTRTLNPRFVN